MKPAFLFERQDNDRVRCRLCSHYCLIDPGEVGRCGVRQNRSGTLYSLVYGRAVAKNIDPIEKKPLFHFQPGTLSYSIAAVGCNFRCTFCQNHSISQMPIDEGRIVGQDAPPRAVVDEAARHGCASISYTYTEPTVFAEYVWDTAEAARAKGLKNVIVSNGFQSPEAVAKLAEVIDAANIDLKAMSDDFYQDHCGGRLKPVLKNLVDFRKRGVWLEATTLLIPGLNDSEVEIKDLTRFLAEEVGPETPWHVSRFHPDYRLLDKPATGVQSLKAAFDIGRAAGLKYVYLGNAPGQGGETTACAACGAELIDRVGFRVNADRLTADKACPGCGAQLDGVF